MVTDSLLVVGVVAPTRNRVDRVKRRDGEFRTLGTDVLRPMGPLLVGKVLGKLEV